MASNKTMVEKTAKAKKSTTKTTKAKNDQTAKKIKSHKKKWTWADK